MAEPSSCSLALMIEVQAAISQIALSVERNTIFSKVESCLLGELSKLTSRLQECPELISKQLQSILGPQPLNQ